MAKVRREEVIAAGLELLDEVGLDGFTTRRLAQRLGVESATLYWHVRDKSALLDEMAATALARHHTLEPPSETDQWLPWLADNARSFRRTLLAYRDGARLHAGTTPSPDDSARLAPKVAYLVRAGLSEVDARMALLTTGQFTIGCVMEEQARDYGASAVARPAVASGDPSGAPLADAARSAELATDERDVVAPPGDVTFEFGLGLILDGLRQRVDAGQAGSRRRARTRTPVR